MSNTSCIDVPFFLFDYISFIPDFFMNFFVVSVFYGTHCKIISYNCKNIFSHLFVKMAPFRT